MRKLVVWSSVVVLLFASANVFAAAPKAAADTEQVVINCTPGRVTYSTQGYPETPKDLFGTSFYNANGV